MGTCLENSRAAFTKRHLYILNLHSLSSPFETNRMIRCIKFSSDNSEGSRSNTFITFSYSQTQCLINKGCNLHSTTLQGTQFPEQDKPRMRLPIGRAKLHKIYNTWHVEWGTTTQKETKQRIVKFNFFSELRCPSQGYRQAPPPI